MTEQTASTKPKRGRPRIDLPASIKGRICREVALGKSLRSVLKRQGMPTMTKVMETLQIDSLFAEQYARARKSGIELHIDGIVDLADTATAENAQAVRLRVDTRKWIASKLVPKVYGDRVDMEVSLDANVHMDGEFSDLEITRRMLYWLHLAEAELRGMGFPELAKQAALREGNINPSPTPTLPALPAPEIVVNARPAQSARELQAVASEQPAEATSTADPDAPPEPDSEQALADARELRRHNRQLDIEIKKQLNPGPTVVTGGRFPWSGRR